MSDTLSELFPHGRCECDGPTCCGGRGPAAFRVTRGGKSMLLCTRCNLSSDTEKVLLVTSHDKASVYADFDALGAMCILLGLFKETEEVKP